MKLLYVCAYLPAEGISAGAHRMFRVIRDMARRHEVHIVSFVETDREQSRVPALESFCASVRTIRRGQSPGEWRRDLLHQVPRSISLEFGNPAVRELLAAELATKSYDLCCVDYLDMAYSLPQYSAVPMLLTHYEVQHRVLLQRFRVARSPLRKLIHASEWLRMLAYEISTCRRFDRVITMTEPDARALRDWDRNLTVVANNTGVDCKYFRPSDESPEPNSVVYTGYFRHKPNVDAVLYFYERVLPRIRERFPTFRFIVVGGEPPPVLQDLARDPAVEITGWVEDMRPYMARATLFVAPIVSGVGIRGKVLEAWAMGKAVVATPLAAEGLAVVEGSNAFVCANPEQFADAIVRLLSHPEERELMEKAGRSTAESTYDWSITLKHLEAEYYAAAGLPRESPIGPDGAFESASAARRA